MIKLLHYLKTGDDKPIYSDQNVVNRLYKKLRIQVLLVITVGYGFVYTCRLVLSVVKKPLIDSGIFSAQDLGIIGSAIFYTYAFGKLTNGFLADHANIRKFFALGVLISAIINLIMGFSTTILLLWVVLWGLNGWFQGFGAPSGIVGLSQWFSISERGRYYGIWSTAHSIGEGLTFVGIAALVSFLGWRAGFIGPGILCVLVALCIFIFMRDRPRTLGLPTIADWKNDHGISGNKTADKSSDTWKMQISIFKIPNTRYLGSRICSCCDLCNTLCYQ
jgi:OPA family sugar phosphate sensor protein UhpC-like MFS transporter